MKYSVIIPTYNEERIIGKTLGNLISHNAEFEIIISDGNSTDKTREIAGTFPVKIINGKRGRGIQMNTAAKIARGDILLFLHADTFLPPNAFEIISNRFADKNVRIATFNLKFDNSNFILSLYSYFTRFESVFTTFGDQVIIVRKKFFEELGGFPDVKIFEDVSFLRKVRNKTKIIKLKPKVITSSRRFEKKGYIKTQFSNIMYFILYYSGKTDEEIYKRYYDE